jgi:DNA-directed RNA polymerase specialized sigma24 family protein
MCALPTPADHDRQLVDRCLAGEREAWDSLYHQCHRPLLASIRAMLGPGRDDPNLSEEIAARVWYAVVADGSQLLARFDPARGCRLSTFLAAVARGQAIAIFRSERRRRTREAMVSRVEQEWPGQSLEQLENSIDEFLKTLTPRERQFCAQILLEQADFENSVYTSASAWQLRSRIHKKLQRFAREAVEV